MTAPGDSAAVSVRVAVCREDAFDVFTREIDLWWRQGKAFRIGGRRRGTLAFEGGVGGRLFETFELPSGPRTFEMGRITEWQPPARLSFEWRGVNFKPGEVTFVEVIFEEQSAGTLVTVRHSGFAALREDHPVRHGLQGPAFCRAMGLWWGQLMTSFREHLPDRLS